MQVIKEEEHLDEQENAPVSDNKQKSVKEFVDMLLRDEDEQNTRAESADEPVRISNHVL